VRPAIPKMKALVDIPVMVVLLLEELIVVKTELILID